MANQIKIESGLTAGTSYCVTKRVTRIGSGTQADICLPSSEVPAHAITLEYRNDAYRVYNRTNRPLVVGDNHVDPGDATDWLDGESVSLPDGTRMTLHLNVESEDSDPENHEASDGVEVDEIDVEDLATVGTNKSRRRLDPAVLKQLLVLVGCIATVAFFVGDFGGSSTVQNSRFEQIMEAGLENKTTSRSLLQELRYAEAALVRKDAGMAKYLFTSMHSELVAQKGQFVAEDRTIELAILNYVQSRVRRLK